MRFEHITAYCIKSLVYSLIRLPEIFGTPARTRLKIIAYALPLTVPQINKAVEYAGPKCQTKVSVQGPAFQQYKACPYAQSKLLCHCVGYIHDAHGAALNDTYSNTNHYRAALAHIHMHRE